MWVEGCRFTRISDTDEIGQPVYATANSRNEQKEAHREYDTQWSSGKQNGTMRFR
tara:strand:+ start:3315 stop:3479 length:165 start_codon:yes stop_codon:yes gene_type:complete